MTNVIVVGAGVIGLFAAARLAEHGARVTLLESEEEDFGGHGPAASLAAAGMLGPVSEALSEKDAHPLLTELCLASFDLWRAQAPEAVWGDGVRFDGVAYLARDGAHAREVEARAISLGRHAAPMSYDQWRKRTGFETRVEHALFIEDEGVADPERVLSGLAMQARRSGAQLMFGRDVEAVNARQARLWDGEIFEADAVVVCPGVWSNRGLREGAAVLERLRPAKGVMVPAALARPLHANVRGPGFYLARRGEHDVVLGSSMEFDNFSRAPSEERMAELLAAAEARLPGEVRRDETRWPWAGVRPMSPDNAPMIGRTASGVFVAAGHGRNGWLLAPITAEMICAHVFGEELPSLWSAFSPARFETGQ